MTQSTARSAPANDNAGTAALTIDELARAVDMSVRNLREWRTLGLLGPPTMVGRSGRYSAEDVEQVRTIQRLHDRGFPLDLIRKLLDGDAELSGDIVRFADAVRTPLRQVRNSGDDPVTRAGRVGEVLAGMGLTAEQIVDATMTVNEHVTAIATIFEDTWLEHVWEPFVARGKPVDERPGIEALLAEVPDRALDAVVALFTVAMQERIENGIEREARRALSGG